MNPKHAWLESDSEFEGIGAHRDNPRYSPVDEPGHDPVTGEPLIDGPDVDPATGDERETEPNEDRR